MGGAPKGLPPPSKVTDEVEAPEMKAEGDSHDGGSEGAEGDGSKGGPELTMEERKAAMEVGLRLRLGD